MLIGLTHLHQHVWFLKWYRNGTFGSSFFFLSVRSFDMVWSHVCRNTRRKWALSFSFSLYTCIFSMASQLCHEPTFVLMNYRQFLLAFGRILLEFLRVKICAARILIDHKLLIWPHSPFEIASFPKNQPNTFNSGNFVFQRQQQQASLVKWNSFILYSLFWSVCRFCHFPLY